MTWPWSHTAEAESYAVEQVYALPDDELREIQHEWRVFQRYGENPTLEAFEQTTYPEEADADLVASLMLEHRECSTGGYRAYVCPYNCECHSVPFAPVQD